MELKHKNRLIELTVEIDLPFAVASGEASYSCIHNYPLFD